MSPPKPYYETPLGKLYHGDCLEIMPELEPVDLVLTSPPYDNLRTYEGFKFDYKQTIKILKNLVSKGGVVVWIIGDQTINGSESGTSFKQALYFKKIGFNIHDTMIYKKDTQPCHDPRNKRYKQIFEYMFIFSNGSPSVYNEIRDIKSKYQNKIIKKATTRKPDGSMRNFANEGRIIKVKDFQARNNIWEYNTDKRGIGHPAIFPEKLACDHIITWSQEGHFILDQFAGSGTTCKIAERLNRRWIGIEIEEKYCEIAAKRIEQERKQLKLFANKN